MLASLVLILGKYKDEHGHYQKISSRVALMLLPCNY